MIRYYSGWEIFYKYATRPIGTRIINEERITESRTTIEEVYRDTETCGRGKEYATP